MKPGLGLGPAVGSGLNERHVSQHERQNADRGLAARHGERAVGQRLPGVRLPEPQRSHGGPGEQARVIAEFVGVLQYLDRRADGRRAALTFTREDQRHPLGDQGEERHPAVRLPAVQRRGPLGGERAWCAASPA